MSYYAVRKGRNPGIYRSWGECRREVDGFAYPKFRKFGSMEEAQSFLSEPTMSYGYYYSRNYNSGNSGRYSYKRQYEYYDDTSSSDSDSESDTKEEVSSYSGWNNHKKARSDYSSSSSSGAKWTNVYTDGSCFNNGRKGAKAGVGVYWGPNDTRNVAEPLEGRPTNNRAEIHASRTAIAQAKSQGISHLRVHTDSKFLIKSVTEWLPKWKRNDWTLSTGGPVKNRKDFEALERDMKGIKVDWKHVRGHQGIVGNEQADRLSRHGANRST